MLATEDPFRGLLELEVTPEFLRGARCIQRAYRAHVDTEANNRGKVRQILEIIEEIPELMHEEAHECPLLERFTEHGAEAEARTQKHLERRKTQQRLAAELAKRDSEAVFNEFIEETGGFEGTGRSLFSERAVMDDAVRRTSKDQSGLAKELRQRSSGGTPKGSPTAGG